MTSVSVTRVSCDQRDHSVFVPKRDIGVIICNFNYIFLTISNINLFHIYFCIGTFLFREILLFLEICFFMVAFVILNVCFCFIWFFWVYIATIISAFPFFWAVLFSNLWFQKLIFRCHTNTPIFASQHYFSNISVRSF